MLSVHRPHLGPAPPSAVPSKAYFLDPDDDTTEPSKALAPAPLAKKTRRPAEAPESPPKIVWNGPAGKWPVTRSSEDHFDRLLIERIAAKNAPPRYVPPPKRSEYAQAPVSLVPLRTLTKRVMWSTAASRKATPEAAYAGPPSKAVSDARAVDGRVDALSRTLEDTLRRSLSGEMVGAGAEKRQRDKHRRELARAKSEGGLLL